MKTKLRFLIRQSLKKKTDTKWFKAANILILILLVGVINIDRIISFFGGDFAETTKIYVVDQANAYELFKTNFDRYGVNGINNLTINNGICIVFFFLFNCSFTLSYNS